MISYTKLELLITKSKRLLCNNEKFLNWKKICNQEINTFFLLPSFKTQLFAVDCFSISITRSKTHPTQVSAENDFSEGSETPFTGRFRIFILHNPLLTIFMTGSSIGEFGKIREWEVVERGDGEDRYEDEKEAGEGEMERIGEEEEVVVVENDIDDDAEEEGTYEVKLKTLQPMIVFLLLVFVIILTSSFFR